MKKDNERSANGPASTERKPPVHSAPPKPQRERPQEGDIRKVTKTPPASAAPERNKQREP